VKVTYLGTEANGTRSVEIRVAEISFRSLIRCLRRLPGVAVTDDAFDPMNDDAKATIRYKDVTMSLGTPFSDFVIDCPSPTQTFDEFVSMLRGYQVRWWDRWL
jgi:hypothetical protein